MIPEGQVRLEERYRRWGRSSGGISILCRVTAGYFGTVDDGARKKPSSLIRVKVQWDQVTGSRMVHFPEERSGVSLVPLGKTPFNIETLRSTAIRN